MFDDEENSIVLKILTRLLHSKQKVEESVLLKELRAELEFEEGQDDRLLEVLLQRMQMQDLIEAGGFQIGRSDRKGYGTSWNTTWVITEAGKEYLDPD